MSDDDNVKRLPVGFKKPPDEDRPSLEIVRFEPEGCDHRKVWRGNSLVDVSYLIREGETEIECSNCGTKLDPMWVITQLAHKESGWMRHRKNYLEEMKRLNERVRTKCDHCGRMTRIGR